MKNRLFLILFALILCVFLSGQMAGAASWYTLPDMYLQNRIDQTGLQYNRFYFELPDAPDSNNSLTVNNVESFILTDPNGNPVPITINDMTFDTYVELTGRYNAGNGTWEWYDPAVAQNGGWTTHGANAPFITHGEFWCHLPSTVELIPGTYTLDVTMVDKTTFHKTYVFKGETVLPMVKSPKVTNHSNPRDSLVTWAVPSVDLVRENPDRNLGARAVVRFMGKTKVGKKTVYTSLGDAIVTVPFNMGMAYFPSFIIDTIISQFNGQIDHSEVCVMTRTNDNSNRVYSKWVKVKNAPHE
jgi:hypothetical protein